MSELGKPSLGLYSHGSSLVMGWRGKMNKEREGFVILNQSRAAGRLLCIQRFMKASLFFCYYLLWGNAIYCFFSWSYAQTQMYTHSIFQHYTITHLKYLGICGRFLALRYPCQEKPNLWTRVSVVLSWKQVKHSFRAYAKLPSLWEWRGLLKAQVDDTLWNQEANVMFVTTSADTETGAYRLLQGKVLGD